MSSSRARLTTAIAEALATVKAHSLPTACERFGLAPGTTQEAFDGKVRYVLKRLERFGETSLLTIAKEVSGAYPTDELTATLEQLEKTSPLITEITRRDLAGAFNGLPVGSQKQFEQIIGKHWPAFVTANSTAQLFATFINSGNRGNQAAPVSNAAMLRAAGFHTSSQTKIFDFLVDVLHPIRSTHQQQVLISEKLNAILIRDGYQLVPGELVSGFPTYKVVQASVVAGQPADNLISEILSSYNEEGVYRAWRKAIDRRKDDPEGAITAAKTLLESVCKHILDEVGRAYGPNDDLPKLYNAAAEQLNLAPSQHTEQVFRAILGNCQSIVSNIAGIRNKHGDSHGQGKRSVKPAARHAELAVNLAGSVSMFLISTLAARKNK